MSKYLNKPITVDNVRFASLKEAERYSQLKTLQQAGKISYLQLQPKFPIAVNGQKICTYKADFRYIDGMTGEAIVEDVKSEPTMTPVYRLKKKLVYALYGIRIVEV